MLADLAFFLHWILVILWRTVEMSLSDAHFLPFWSLWCKLFICRDPCVFYIIFIKFLVYIYGFVTFNIKIYKLNGLVVSWHHCMHKTSAAQPITSSWYLLIHNTSAAQPITTMLASRHLIRSFIYSYIKMHLNNKYVINLTLTWWYLQFV